MGFPWGIPKQVWIVLGVLFIFGIATEGVLFYGDQREKYGQAMERAAWVEKYNRAIHERDVAQAALVAVQAERDRAIAERDAIRNAAVTHAQQEIVNAPDAPAAYAAYIGLYNRLRDESAASRTRAWADYSATVASAPSGRARPPVAHPVSFFTEAGSGRDLNQPGCVDWCA